MSEEVSQMVVVDGEPQREAAERLNGCVHPPPAGDLRPAGY